MEDKCCMTCGTISSGACGWCGSVFNKALMWDCSKDYCSKYEQKEESEVDNLKEKLRDVWAPNGNTFKDIAEYVLKNYVSKEKLLLKLSEYEPCVVMLSDEIKDDLMLFIEDKTK